MTIARLIDALRRPSTYPHPVDGIEIRQTHISVVALAGPFAYKVKKPLDLGFLDFRRLDQRLHFCREEVRLNRRMAPDVYLGVVAIVEREGELRLGEEHDTDREGARPDSGEAAVEYAVKMRRLPERATLRARLEAGELTPEVFARLGERVAKFHAAAASGPEIDRYGKLDVVASNARENLVQSRSRVGRCLSEEVFARLGARLDQRLAELGPLIQERASEHCPRDTHGDLHLAHVYLFPERPPPADLVAIDCVEFNERFRYSDPVSDMAFLVMDLLFHGRKDLADAFGDAYFDAADDPRGPELLPFYVAYRAAVRAKVDGMAADEEDVPEEERREAVRRARAYWLLALSELESAGRRPCLVVVGGLPGTGKSTLAEGLAGAADFEVVSSDRVRKELAGIEPGDSAAAGFGRGLYTADWTERTYAACLERAEALLFEGKRVIVDASFRSAARRSDFRDLARRMGVRSCMFVCTAPPEVVKRRLAERRGGASDADWAVYVAAAEVWEEIEGAAPEGIFEVPRVGAFDRELAVALEHLGTLGMAPDGARAGLE